MRWIGFALALGTFGSTTGGALLASAQGWGLSGMLDKPVSIRQASVRRRRMGVGPAFLYFGGPRRRHFGGGFRGGK